ncbi:lactonase family protein [Thalassotalea sp. PLHSN55]|uniref:lactonase family protein n=1 Tax=Thalassotalea sp. PLHSN55 TaxID=3435888 RepID=UPI003F846567
MEHTFLSHAILNTTTLHKALLNKVINAFYPLTIAAILLTLPACSSIEEQTQNHVLSNQPRQQQNLLIGAFNNAGEAGLFQLTFSPKQATLTKASQAIEAPNPVYLATQNKHQDFFTVVGKKSGGLAHYQFNPNKQSFELKSQLTNINQGACHIAMHPNINQVAVADYATGEVSLFAVNEQGNKKQLSLLDKYTNQGKSITKRQQGPHSHYVQWDRTGKFLYAVDLGTDEVLLFNNSAENHLADKKVAAKLSAGDGPRHMVFHPNMPVVYVINELSNVVAVYQQNEQTGLLSLMQRVSALTLQVKEEQATANFASAIKISNDARFIYAAIRGINKIAVFGVAKNGELELIQLQSTLGNWPRDITLSAEQNYLFIANKRSNEITVLKRDQQNGLLSPTTIKASIPQPAYIGLY